MAEPYHVRPFPQQPRRGGKKLVMELDDIEAALAGKIPDFEKLGSAQARMHHTANSINDDKLVNHLAHLSEYVDKFREEPSQELMQKVLVQIMKIRIELKHL